MIGEFYREIVENIRERRADVAQQLVDGRAGGSGKTERYMVGQIVAFDEAIKTIDHVWHQKEQDA